MATLKEALTQTKQLRIPLNAYKIKVLEPKFLVSKEKKTPYYALECETQGNSPIMIDGSLEDINGMKAEVQIYITERNVSRIVSAFELAEIPLPDIQVSSREEAATKLVEKILENPMPELFRGKEFRATCVSTHTAQLTEDKQPILDSKGQPLAYLKFEIKSLI